MNAVIYYISFPFLWIVSRLPFWVFYILSDILCIIVYRIVGYRKNIVRSNLRLAFPNYNKRKLLQIERKFYSHLCDVFIEVIKSMGMSKREMLKRFNIKNIETIMTIENQKRSFFIMCGHYGSWEWMMSLGYHTKNTTYGIYTPIRNQYFDNLIKKIRGRHNAYVIPQRMATKNIKENEKQNIRGAYGFASDQSPRPKQLTYWRSFLGINVPVYTGAERLARELNIPIVFVKIKRVKRGYYEAEFILLTDKPKSQPENAITDKFTELLQEQIREDPTQYFWTHKRFKYMKKN